jgi:hypothetical protein
VKNDRELWGKVKKGPVNTLPIYIFQATACAWVTLNKIEQRAIRMLGKAGKSSHDHFLGKDFGNYSGEWRRKSNKVSPTVTISSSPGLFFLLISHKMIQSGEFSFDPRKFP